MKRTPSRLRWKKATSRSSSSAIPANRQGETVVVQEAAPMILPAAAAARSPARRQPLRLLQPGGCRRPGRAGGEVADDRDVLWKPSPDADSYVEVGSVVEPDTVVCIIEAMKVNEIKAEVKGTIAEVLVDSDPVGTARRSSGSNELAAAARAFHV